MAGSSTSLLGFLLVFLALARTSKAECPSGWQERAGYCYKSENTMTSLTWQQARDFCRSKAGGDLVSLHSDDEMRFVFGLVYRKIYRGLHWIGLHNDAGTLKWSDGSSVDYTNWGSGEPKDKHGMTKCVALRTGYGLETPWSTYNCMTSKWFFCKVKKDEVTPPSPTQIPPPPDCGMSSMGTRWFYDNGYCYTVSLSDRGYTQVATWRSAREKCQKEGGDLTSITDRQEHDFISSLLGRWRAGPMNHIITDAWMGFNSIDRKGFQWSDGSKVSVKYWQDGHPDPLQECANMEPETGFWRSSTCADQKPYVCKRSNSTETTVAVTSPATAPPRLYCPQGFTEVGEKCFKIFGTSMADRKSFNDARAACRALTEGRLPEIAAFSNAYEQAAVAVNLLGMTTSVWFGILPKTGCIDSNIKWADGSETTYQNWIQFRRCGEREPHCSVMRPKPYPAGKWQFPVPCETKLPYVCQTYKDSGTPILTPEPTPTSKCPAGFLPYGDACYGLVNVGRSLVQSRAVCRTHGGDLASIQDELESSFVFSLSREAISAVWIGISREKSNYRWLDGLPVTYANWKNSQPNPAVGDCVKMVKDAVGKIEPGLWESAKCDDVHPSICKISFSRPLPPTPSPSPGACPGPDWIEVGSRCFLFQKNGYGVSSFAQAAVECKGKGAELVSIHNIEENDALHRLARLKKEELDFWIGMTERKSGGKRWWDGSAIDFTNWMEGEPKNLTESCGKMEPFTGKWLTVDQNECKLKPYSGYVCATDKDTGMTTPRPTVPTPDPDAKCPSEDWVKHNNRCYYFHKRIWRSSNFAVANMECKALGGALTSVSGQEENDFIASQIKERNLGDVWIGYLRVGRATPKYMWMDNSQSGYTNWDTGEPRYLGNYGCVYLRLYNGKWKDQWSWEGDCGDQYKSFVCKTTPGFSASDTSTKSSHPC